MLRFLSSLTVFGVLAANLAGCSADSSSEGTAAAEVNAGNNTDVQVISAKSFGTVSWGIGGGSLDAKKCEFSDRRPYTQSHEFTSYAKADCTEAFIAARGPSINRYVELNTAIRETPDIVWTSFRHWCGEVEVVVAVKAAAWDSPSFQGIGFYGYEYAVNSAEDQRRVFYPKSDSRLSRIGEGYLKNEGHQKVYLYKFSGAGPCEPNGSGDNPSGAIEFKPYVTFTGENERWEAVQANHKVRYHETWSRQGDLLD